MNEGLLLDQRPATRAPPHLSGVIDWLQDNSDLNPAAFARAERAAEASGERLDLVLTKLGMVAEDLLAEAYSVVCDLKLVADADIPDAPLLADTLSAAFLKNAQVLPLQETGNALHLAVVDPLDAFAISSIAKKTGLVVQPSVITSTAFSKAFGRLYVSAAGPGAEAETAVGLTDELTTTDIGRLKDLGSDAPVIRIVNDLVRDAIEFGASDIHISADRKGLRVRFRVDGVLQDVEAPPATLRPALISRLKIMANLDIAEQRLPQDGRIRIVVRGREIDLRLATMPHLHGEGAVLRILDRSQLALDYAALGFGPQQIDDLDRLLGNANGIFLVAGPTGSGKTTTLYAALAKLARPEKNIITVEDPIEYQLDGVNQVQIRPKIGLDFARALRAILRQDPDIIMVGEIRDRETAIIANQAALTGHLVLATLHTNTAAAALPRLVDMGLEDYLLASTVRGVLSQRLVRTLCQGCKTASQITDLERQRVTRWLGETVSPAPGRLWRPAGCEACRDTGYAGRAVVAEILFVSDAVRSCLLAKADAGGVQKAAQGAGMVGIAQDAWDKVARGVTSLDEVLQVAGGEAS